MANKKFVLHFPPHRIEEPIVFHLIKDFDLTVNILQGTVVPGEEGRLIVELGGDRKKLNRGLEYLAGLGVSFQPLVRDVHWYKSRCTHCTACVPLCPTKALVVSAETFTVSFDKKRCIACGLCVRACPYKAIKVL